MRVNRKFKLHQRKNALFVETMRLPRAKHAHGSAFNAASFVEKTWRCYNKLALFRKSGQQCVHKRQIRDDTFSDYPLCTHTRALALMMSGNWVDAHNGNNAAAASINLSPVPRETMLANTFTLRTQTIYLGSDISKHLIIDDRKCMCVLPSDALLFTFGLTVVVEYSYSGGCGWRFQLQLQGAAK
jgi:hypothetical protein